MSQIEQSIKLNGQRNDHSIDDPLNAVSMLNQRSMERLIRAIDISQGEFALIIVHCNYSHLRQNILNELANTTGLLYREIWWRISDAPIYQKLQDFIADCHYHVPALMCLGLEHFGHEMTDTSIHVFAEINLFRDRLKHQLNYPLVLWLNDENLEILWQKAPDFANLSAPPIKFALSTLELIQELDQQVERLFHVAQDPLVPLFWQDLQIDDDPDILSYQELEMARCELRIAHHHQSACLENDRQISLTEDILQSQFHKSCAELQAKLDLAMGRLLWRSPRTITKYTNDVYVESQGEVHSVSQIYYECSLLYWRKVEKPVEEGIVLFYLGNLWWHNSFVRGRAVQASWQRAKQYFQEAIACFQRAQREDLVAKYGRAYSGVLEQLQLWQELTDWINQLLPLHRLNPLELAQDYGYLAKVAISRGSWRDVMEQAAQALSILESRILFDSPLNGSHNNSHEPNFEQHCQRLRQIQIGQCQLLIAQSQYRLGEIDVAIAIIERALANFNCQDEPHLYIRMLDTFHDLAFAKGLYLPAFYSRQQQRSLEQQYGLRAFIGAGSLQPKQLAFGESVDAERSKLAQQKTEIAASGRSQDVEHLIHRILAPAAQQLTVIHGESGVGKSSLVNAGLIPALWQRSLTGFAILPIKVSIYTNWLQAIAIAMQQTPSASMEVILTRFNQLASQGTQVVLIFDQFEEFFFTNTQPDDRQIFRQFWQTCLHRPYLKLVISIREDYLHLLLELETVNGEIDILSRDRRYALVNLSPADATALIENLTQQANFPLESALIDRLVQDLAGDRGSVRPIELQLVGSQLQDRNMTTLADYQAAGGKQKLVEQSVQEVIQACGDAAFVAQQVLIALTDEQGKRPLRTYNELRNFILPYTSNSLDLDLVLEILVGSGIIFQLPESPSNRYQLVHDYLVPFIRANQESELLGELQKVRSVAETRRVRLARLTKFALFGTVVGLILMASLAFQAIHQRRIAEIGEINALVSSATSSFLLNQQLQALTTILQSAQKLATFDADPMQFTNQEIDKDQTFRNTYEALQLIIYNIRERYRFIGINRDSPFYVAKFSPDGKMMALGGYDGSVYLLDGNGKLLRTMTGFKAKEIRGLSFSADSKRIASSGNGGLVRIWDVRTGGLIREFQAHDNDIFRVDFHPDSKRLLTGSKDGLVKLWDSDRGVLLLTIDPLSNQEGNQAARESTSFVARQAAAIQDTSFSPDGKMIVTAKSNAITLWDLEGKQLAEAIAHKSIIYMARFNPQGNQLVSTGDDKVVKLWQITNQNLGENPLQLELKQVFEGNPANVLSVNFSRDGSKIAFGMQDNAIIVFNLDGTIDSTIGAHKDAVFDVTFSPDDQYLLSASKDRTARLWYIQTALLKTIYAHKNPIWGVSFAPNGKIFASGSVDKNIFVWNADGTRRMSLIGHKDTVYGVNFSSDSKYLVSASEDRTVKIWDSRTGELLHSLDIHGSGLINAMFSPDRQILATLGADHKIKLWRWNQTNQPTLIHELKDHTQTVWSIAFSPDGRFIASTGNDETVKIWDVATGKARSIPQAHKNGGLAVAYSPDGKLIASSGKDSKIKIWDAATGRLRREISVNGEAIWIYGIAFSPDGKAIASGNADKSIKIYDISNGQILKTLTAHNAEVHAIAFSPDSQNLVSVSRDNSIKIWNAETLNFDQLVARGCQMLKAHTQNSPNSDRDKICR